MNENTTHKQPRFSTARIVALVAIAAIVAGLGIMRAGRGEDRVTVPAGAHAGDLTLKPCQYDTKAGKRAAECGRLIVPENRNDPESRLIALPITRIPARSDHPGKPIFRLEGGPGLTNMKFPDASRFDERHDVVLVGYRGVDGSSVLDCPEVTDVLRSSHDLLAAKSLTERTDAFRDCAKRLQGEGVDLAGYTLPQRVEDFEAARKALGYDQVDLISQSAGTRTAMIYGWRHPRSIHRSVMIAANPPGHYVWDPAQSDSQLADYERRGAGGVAALRRKVDDVPDSWGFLPIKQGNVRAATFFALMEARTGPLTGPLALDAWKAADDGDASGLWLMSLMADVTFARAQVWGEVAAAARVDVAAAERHFAAQPGRDAVLRDYGSEFVWAKGELAKAWPANADDNAYSRVRDSDVHTLLIGGTLDGAAPPANGERELLPHLRNGRQVKLDGIGHAGDFWSVQSSAATHLIETYLSSGRVDASRYEKKPLDVTPSPSYAGIAKALADGMMGLAIVALLSLGLMWLRVRRRGRLGRKSSAVLRSLYPLVLGLGGWFAATLIAMALFPALPIDSMGLVVISAGTAIGAGVYLAWVDRSWSVARQRAGLALAVGGALVGALLGFHVADSPVAVLTAVVAAGAGANLALIVRDVATRTAPRARRAVA